MPAMSIQLDLKHVAALLKSAHQAIALTGAGISTPSGIPDFRSASSGLWERYDPMAVASLSAFRYNPAAFYDWIHPLARSIFEATPNEAHIALARLERNGYLRGVITQNIDGLHQRAGSRSVLEVHGHLRRATCIACYRKYPTEQLLTEFLESGDPPRCPSCQGVLKPDAVLFGEQLPIKVMRRVDRWVAECDLMIVAGSSLEVTPVALLPVRALESGADLVIVNHTPTYVDARAVVVIRADVAKALPRVADLAIGVSATD